MLGKIALYLSFTLLGFSICYGIHNAVSSRQISSTTGPSMLLSALSNTQ